MTKSDKVKILREMANGQDKLAKYYARVPDLSAVFTGKSDALNAGAEALEENERLLAQMTPEPIADKHKDGKLWLVWHPVWEAWVKGRWQFEYWAGASGAVVLHTPTHALPMPPAPEVKNAD